MDIKLKALELAIAYVGKDVGKDVGYINPITQKTEGIISITETALLIKEVAVIFESYLRGGQDG